MKLVFEKGSAKRKLDLISPYDAPQVSFERAHTREKQPRFPHLPEDEINHHYTEPAKRSHGVNDGSYPLGSCIMKYNPRANEEAATLEGSRGVHPLQPEAAVQGSMEVLYLVERHLCEIVGMGATTFQPVAGAHGEFTGLLLIKAYHAHHGDVRRAETIIPDPAYGTSPTDAATCGYDVVSIPSREDSCVDLEQLKAAVGDDTTGLMLTDPDTVGLFDENILEITKVVYDAGGLCYHDGANPNAAMGIVRSGDMRFNVVHLGLHETFSMPHGGGRPGSDPVGYKEFLEPFIPDVRVEKKENAYHFVKTQEPIGGAKMSYDNFLAVVKALVYILTLGKGGISETAHSAVLDANYMRVKLSDVYDIVYNETCMHEFVTSLEKMKHDRDVNAMDITKALLDYGIRPPTMHFPLIVHEVLMVEPTETKSKETLDEVIKIFYRIYKQTLADPEILYSAPYLIPIGRPNKVTVTRKPVLCHTWE